MHSVETEPMPYEAPRRRGFRTAGWMAFWIVAGAVAFFGIVLLAYELAAARVPQHRASLERLVRAQTGLNIHFDELGLRWGWYGPEAVFRRVELGEPDHSTVRLRAPELVVGFDIWQTLRTGQFEAGRITLVAADIDLVGPRHSEARAHAGGESRSATAKHSICWSCGDGDGGIRLLKGWQGGRVDLDGGTLKLPDPTGGSNPVMLQIRRASLRRVTSEWSGYGLVFLPERLGRTAQLAIRLDGDLEQPRSLSGTVRFEGRRLAFGGWRELLGPAARYLPHSGGGDVELDLELTRGRLVKASGKVNGGGLEFAAADESQRAAFALDHLRGEWRLAQRESGWRLQIESLELGTVGSGMPASLSLESTASGSWIRGTLEEAPLQTVAGIAHWLTPQFDTARLGLAGTVRNIVFDWNTARPVGQRLRTAARLVDVEIAPPSQSFTLTGLAGQVSGSETQLLTQLETRAARLERAAHPLSGVRVDARLQISRDANSWQIKTEKLELQHETAHLRVAGSVTATDAVEGCAVDARAELTGADVPQLQALAGEELARAFGATFAQLTSGHIERAQLELHGPFDPALLGTGASGELVLSEAAVSGGDSWPEMRGIQAQIDWRGARVQVAVAGGQLQVVAGVPAIEALRGGLVFDGGHLRRSVLTGTWLGGPVVLNLGERRERGAAVLVIQGRGVLEARELALAATAGTQIDESRAPAGRADWNGELAYTAATDSRPAQWRVRADSTLVGIVSRLPEPLPKAGAAAMPLHVEAQGTASEAQLHLSLGDRLRSLLALRRRSDTTWRVERGNVQFGKASATLPDEPVVLVEGRLKQLDLPAYVVAWQQLRAEPAAPAIRADLVAGELLVAGHRYREVRVLAERTDLGADLRLQSPEMLGTAQWPAHPDVLHPARFHFARLNVPDGGAFAASAELIAALGPATDFSVDDIVWEGRSIGSAQATVLSGGDVVDVTDLRLSGSTQDVTGNMRCQVAGCRLRFNLDSSDAAATLEDFGFRADLTAARAALDGDLAWRVGSEEPALATLTGRLNMRLQEGTTRADPDRLPDPRGAPFPLLLVPALVSGMGEPTVAPTDPDGLRFSRLDADFEINHGEAVTSNLHFDGDAEILMRGRAGLLARDYDTQVWILRGEGRLPAAVRRLAPTPRVAAAWLSLRELFTGSRPEERAKAPLHLQGSWDDPIVVAAE
jgi:uncharacterized protein YhdP